MKNPPSKRLGLSLLLIAPLLAAPARAATFRVGAGAGCSHSNLADAIAAAASAAGADEIRLLSGSSHQGVFFVLNNPVTIKGGYSSCTATAATGSSTLRGGNGTAAIAVALAADQAARLERLTIEGGTNINGNGGGISIGGRGLVELVEVQAIAGQVQGRGGNLYITGHSELGVRIYRSVLAAGEAADGGGIGCAGPSTLVLERGSSVANNTASGNGGGIFLADGCILISRAGGNLSGIASNVAAQGGGVYLEDGSLFQLESGGDNLSASVAGNQAARGGGIYATGTATLMTSNGGAVEGNSATGEGGGIYLADHATAYFSQPNVWRCGDSRRCTSLSANTAGEGGAAYVGGSAGLQATNTYLENNVSTLRHSVASLAGASFFRATNVVLAANRGVAPIGIAGSSGTSFSFENVTVAGNLDTGPSFFALNGSNAAISIVATAFSQSGTLFAGGPAGFSPRLDCVMASSSLLASVPAAAQVRAVVAGDPRFESARLGYQLQIGSPAIDFCDTAPLTGILWDIEGDRRLLDDPSKPNQPTGGARDLGADEMVRIFADGFESGNTAAWSLTGG